MIFQEGMMLYLQAIKNNFQTIDEHTQIYKVKYATFFSFSIKFSPVYNVVLRGRDWFNVVGIMEIYNNGTRISDPYLCAEFTKQGIILFWVGGFGRIEMKDQKAQTPNMLFREVYKTDADIESLVHACSSSFRDKERI